MKSSSELRTLLRSVDHKSYPAYKSLAGSYQFGNFMLFIDHVQGDPFASPSSLHVEILHRDAGFPEAYYAQAPARVALQDHLTRQFSSQFEDYNFKAKGSGKSGLIATSRPGQEILARTACEIGPNSITARFEVGFPAFGRTIHSGELIRILFDFLPGCVRNVFFYKNRDKKEVLDVIELSEDQEFIRGELKRLDLVSFAANGSILPRETGISDRPMKDSIPFTAPDSLSITLELPHRGPLSGLAVRRGITLIVGGDYHGKSTLLKALESGVYNHIAGDGREYVITDCTAVKLRAEDGRSINNVDISLFINDLPNGKNTAAFSTADASGSTSQAAAVIEGVESGARAFLIDEDTSATNFMLRDDLMQRIVSRDKEPITPFIERARDLYEQAGISTVLVAGSSGAYFFIADTVLQMDSYRPYDITDTVKAACQASESRPEISAPGFRLPEKGRRLASSVTGARRSNGLGDIWDDGGRNPGGSPEDDGDSRNERGGRDSRNGRDSGNSGGSGYGRGGGYGRGERGGRNGRDGRDGRGGGRGDRIKVKVRGKDAFQVAKEPVDLRFVEQLADSEQTNALAQMVRYCLEKGLFERCTLQEIVSLLIKEYEKHGLSAFTDASYAAMGLCLPRAQEIYACLNRFRG